MNLFISTIFVLSTALSATQENPANFIEKHFKLIGGKDKLEKLVSVKRVGTINFPDHGQPRPKGSGAYETRILYPDRVRVQIHVGTYKVDQIRNKDKYWDFDGKSYFPITDIKKQSELHDTSLKANRELLWWEREHQSFRKVNSLMFVSNSNCISGIKNSSTEFICFDKTSGLLSASGNDFEYRLYNDWRTAGDIKMPFSIEQYKNGLLSYSIKLDTVKVNMALTDGEFVP